MNRYTSRIPRPSPNSYPPPSPQSQQLNDATERINTVASTISNIADEATANAANQNHNVNNNNNNNNNIDQERALWNSPRQSSSSNNNNSANNNNRTSREAPWLKDQRQAPRSVRTPPPYTNNNKHNKRQQHNRNKTNTNNPFDSPAASTINNGSTGSSSSTVATPASRNPSISEDNGHRRASGSSGHMLNTPQKQQQQQHPPPPPPPPPKHSNRTMYHARNNNNNNNPFDSPATSGGRVIQQQQQNLFTSGTTGSRVTNPFDSPSLSIQQQQQRNININNLIMTPRREVDEFDEYNYPNYDNDNNNHPFDTPNSSDESIPNVRVTVHTEQNAPPTPNNNNNRQQQQQQRQQQQRQQQQRHPYHREVRKVTMMPFSPISSSSSSCDESITKPDPSVALDSLEQTFLDITEDTVDESNEEDEEDEESDDVEYGNEEEEGDNRDEWSDEPHFKHQQQHGHHHQQQQQQHQHQQEQHQEYFDEQQQFYSHPPPPPPPPPATPTPSYFSSSSQTAGSNTPSEKALIAAESLRKSFEHRRRQKKNNNAVVASTTTVSSSPKRIDPAARMLVEEDNQNNNKIGERQHQEIITTGGGTTSSSLPTGDGLTNDPDGVLYDLESGAVISAGAKQTTTTKNTGESLPHDILSDKDQQQIEPDPPNSSNNENKSNDDNNFTLHDLCDEAISTDDLAWHNALYLLSVRPDLGRGSEPECMMTPLHVACLAQEPPPVWMTRGLLYAAPETCRQTDQGGRLPLHLLVATSAHIDTIRLLVEEYPPGVSHKDDRGFTPLQLLLKRNDPIQSGLTLEHLRLLLGQQQQSKTSSTKRYGGRLHRRGNQNDKFSFRKGDHLKNSLKLQDLDALADERQNHHESMFREYPDDVRRALNKLSQWKRRQVNKNRSVSNRSEEENKFLESREADFINPGSIPTPTGQLLPLHLLVRKNIQVEASQDITSAKKATIVDLLRVLIAAYPQGLVEVDANGKTPIMTAMLQTDSSPSEEVIELLLGLRTPGFGGRSGMDRPALIPSGDTYQLPLHVAAEELLSNYSLLSTICEAHPDARTIQDIRGRTPLHLAFQNYRSVPVDEATLELLFVEPVAKIKDNDGKTPLDLLLENPKYIIRKPSSLSPSSSKEDHSTILQEFFDASIEKPRNRREAQEFIVKFQNFPPWLRRQACAARFVQDILVEEIASPFTTFRIIGSGCVLILLLVALRRMLHVNTDYSFLIYYLATYHFIIQLIHWGTSIYMGECFRLCIANLWRWFDLATVILSIWCAIYVSLENNIIDDGDGDGSTLLSPLGASATIACWLSLLGYGIEWCCGLAVFVGSATQLLSILVWPLCVAVMVFFATSQVLFTLEDCTTGGICSLSESYAFVYGLVLGVPVLTDNNYEISMGMFVIIVIFTILCIWWIMSIIAMIVTEANRLDRRQISLTWYWEPKVTLTVMASSAGNNNNEKVSDSPSYIERYCDTSEKFWHIFVSALRGERSDVHWDACCFRSKPMLVFAGFLALFLLPIWLILGFITLGLLWPPQIRRWLFCPCPIGSSSSSSSTKTRRRISSSSSSSHEDDLSRAKLSQLRSDIIDLKGISYDQNHRIQKDLELIKEIIFRAAREELDE
jgi:hypothetical protein